MKRILCLISVLVLIFCASCTSTAVLEETSMPAENIDELAARIGIEMNLPDKAGNVQCAIINDLIAEVSFTYNGIVFVHRTSKAYSGTMLYGMEEIPSRSDSFSVSEGTEAFISSFKDGATLVEWYENGNHHSLYSSKVVGTDLISEIVKSI